MQCIREQSSHQISESRTHTHTHTHTHTRCTSMIRGKRAVLHEMARRGINALIYNKNNCIELCTGRKQATCADHKAMSLNKYNRVRDSCDEHCSADLSSKKFIPFNKITVAAVDGTKLQLTPCQTHAHIVHASTEEFSERIFLAHSWHTTICFSSAATLIHAHLTYTHALQQNGNLQQELEMYNEKTHHHLCTCCAHTQRGSHKRTLHTHTPDLTLTRTHVDTHAYVTV